MSIQSKFRKIVLTEAPSGSNDVTTKSYVDGLVDGRREDITSTTNNTVTTIATIGTTSGSTTVIISNITAVRTNVSDASAAFQLRSAYKNTGAALEQIGIDDLTSFKNTSAVNYNSVTTSSGTDILIQIQGDTGHDVDWKAITNVFES